MTRFEFMIRNGKEGVQLGIIEPDIAIKYEAYVAFLDIMETLEQRIDLTLYQKRAQAVKMTGKKFKISYSTIWRYLAFFDYVKPTKEQVTLYKNQTRWSISK